MPRPFPTQPSLEHFRKQAKQLLRDLRNGQTDAAGRIRRSHPRFAGAGQLPAISLHDAQLVVAREFGFASWRRLQDKVVSRPSDAADAKQMLVTGGAGFIGSHLAESLLARGCHVVVLDDLSTGRRENVAHLLDSDRFELIVGDVCDSDLIDRLVAAADVTFHLAADIGHRPGSFDPLRLWRTNVEGTQAVVEACSRHRARLLLTSSSVVYGKTEGRQTLREDADLILDSHGMAGWEYAVSKVANEHLTQAHMAQHDLQATIVRPFNVIGPRSEAAVVPVFLQQAREGRALTIHGDGSSRRCFTDVRDVVEAFIRLAATPHACGETVNIGSRTEFSLQQLAALVKATTHSDSPVQRIPYDRLPEGAYQQHIPWKTPNLSRARQLIGYAAVHSVEECLQEMVALGDG